MSDTAASIVPKTGISPAQQRLLHVARRQLGMDEETWRGILRDFGKVASSADLTPQGFNRVIKHLEYCGFQKTGGRKNHGILRRKAHINRPDGKITALVTREQLDKIELLAGLVAWRKADGFDLWREQRMGIKRVRTDYDAYRVTEGLKKMFERQMAKQHGKLWWTMPFDDPRIMTYIDEHCPAEHKDCRAMMVIR